MSIFIKLNALRIEYLFFIETVHRILNSRSVQVQEKKKILAFF